MSDKELLQKIIAGDRLAFGRLYHLFKAKVYSTAYSYLRQTEDAEEVAQDVFVEIHRSAGKFDGKSALSTWVFRVTVNKSLDKLRYRNAKKRFIFLPSVLWQNDETAKNAIPDSTHHGIESDKQESIYFLLKAIEQLPEKQKTAVILTQIEELSGKETAEIMETTPKAVESLIQRGKANLKKELEKIYDNPKETNKSNV